ncbi:NUDIX domain-containing protein [Cellulomonas bogoriensis]|uniref:ADP-ribose pyrophosphatase n=1 Tax=Cellulomonas bogoriensis 69B4 = DSM 16987 TaxID=1386082 RepID=A0A0A0C153_9CELL|nr:NUDIX hydrolase [Cellulomonas bogoriensis]KGM13672.1 ADP-ribose pyrophosphatase [Cellulomonas bogoriensis 69B4 = DSM 16987]
MADLRDAPGARRTVSSRTIHQGMVWDVVGEDVDLGEPGTVHREFVRHPGAVSVIVLDDEDRVLLLSQYRHPVRSVMWEPPAGLLDVEGEDPWTAARRELLEEADLEAGSWWVLADYVSSPGGSDETLRVFLARDVREVPEGRRHHRVAEESQIVCRWVPLDEAVTAVLAGQVRNPSAVVGVLAAATGRSRDWRDLRAPDVPLP